MLRFKYQSGYHLLNPLLIHGQALSNFDSWHGIVRTAKWANASTGDITCGGGWDWWMAIK
jgi:hypothetical protein